MPKKSDFTISQTLKMAIKAFRAFGKNAGIENARLEAELLLSHAMGISRSQILINSEDIVPENQYHNFKRLVSEKLTGKPTAYILENAEFFGRKFIVDNSVLIPRPETEELVEWIILSRAKNSKSKNPGDPEKHENILDLCTGSGCIGITLLCEMITLNIYMSDRSENALKIAGKNLEILKIQNLKRRPIVAEILKSDLFDEIRKDDFDLIVSNPPYVTPSEYDTLEAPVKNFEPREALLVEDSDTFNRRLIQGAFDHLRKSGWLYLETSPALIESLGEILNSVGYTNVETKKDLSGKDRFIRAQKP